MLRFLFLCLSKIIHTPYQVSELRPMFVIMHMLLIFLRFFIMLCNYSKMCAYNLNALQMWSIECTVRNVIEQHSAFRL